MDEKILEEKLLQMKKEYAKKKRRLKKCQRSASAKAHVQKRLQEQHMCLSQEEENSKETLESEIPVKKAAYVATNTEKTPFNTQDSSERLADISNTSSFTCDDIVESQDIFKSQYVETVLQARSKDKKSRLRNEKNALLSPQQNHRTMPSPSSTGLNTDKYRTKNLVYRRQNNEDDKLSICKDKNTSSPNCIKSLPKVKYGIKSETQDRLSEYTSNQEKIVSDTLIACNDSEQSEKAKNIVYEKNVLSHKTACSLINHIEPKVGNDTKEFVDTPKNNISNYDMDKCDTTCTPTNGRIHKSKSNSQLSETKKTDHIPQSTGNSSSKSSIHSDKLSDLEILDDLNLSKQPKSRKRRSSGGVRQRQSSRLAELSSQDNSSQSDITSLGVILQSPKVKKRVIVSSVFQCLVDEVKRQEKTDEFFLPEDYNMDMCNRLNISDLDIKNKRDTTMEGVNDLSKSSAVSLQLSPIPRHEEKSDSFNMYHGEKESLEVTSPTLFDSQSNSQTRFKFDVENLSTEAILVSGILTKDEVDCAQDMAIDIVEIDTVVQDATDDNKAFTVAADSHFKDTDDVQLRQTHNFKIPSNEPLLSLVAMETDGLDGDCIVCLCSSTLRVYRYSRTNQDWNCVCTHRLTTQIKKSSSFHLYAVPCVSVGVSVVLQHYRVDSNNITMYTYIHDRLISLHVDDIWARSIQVCPVSDHLLIIGHYTDQRTFMTKYTRTNHQDWTQMSMDSCDDQITGLVTIQGLDMAVLGLTSAVLGMVHIWNTEYGHLLSSVDISDVCPYQSICPKAYSEKGYVFLPVMYKKKCVEAGSIIVINPELNSSETLTSLQNGNQPWMGCSQVTIMNRDLLLAKETCGRVHIWDVFTGDHLATIDDVTVTCLTSTNQHLVLAHKQCIHVYKLRNILKDDH